MALTRENLDFFESSSGVRRMQLLVQRTALDLLRRELRNVIGDENKQISLISLRLDVRDTTVI
jgi:hypothetical protein